MSDSHETEFESPRATARDPWDSALERLRVRFPAATLGTLFCVHKLEMDPQLSLKDFRDEAALRSIGLSGRSVHSAKVLLGLQAPSVRRKKVEVEVEEPAHRPVAQSRTSRRVSERAMAEPDSLESTLLSAVQQLQAEATADARHLRTAIREAIAVLQEALTKSSD